MPRETLPNRRRSEIVSLSFAGERYNVGIGFYLDSRPGEVFITRVRDKAAARLGEQLDGVCRDGAIMLSLALQSGIDVETLQRAVTRDGEGHPATIVGAVIDQLATAA